MGLEKRTRVISPTYPGFGASQSNNGSTFMSFGEDVKELLDNGAGLDADHTFFPKNGAARGLGPGKGGMVLAGRCLMQITLPA